MPPNLWLARENFTHQHLSAWLSFHIFQIILLRIKTTDTRESWRLWAPAAVCIMHGLKPQHNLNREVKTNQSAVCRSLDKPFMKLWNLLVHRFYDSASFCLIFTVFAALNVWWMHLVRDCFCNARINWSDCFISFGIIWMSEEKSKIKRDVKC